MSKMPLAEAVRLFHSPLEELQSQAQEIRNLKHPKDQVTFVLDSNPNYTNICHIDCSFCAFYRHAKAKDAYTKSVEEVMAHFEFARKNQLTTVLLQGGVNAALPLSYYLELVQTARTRYPEIHPHFFSAVELYHLSLQEKLSLEELLLKFWEVGLRTIPGAGAEILTEEVRQVIAPKKITTQQWLEFHHTAHRLGYKTTATMMYGHVETIEDIILHLENLRATQEKIPGFTSFIPWSYKPGRTALRRKVKEWIGPDLYFRVLAFARIYLDNFDHIAASWFGEGKEVGMKALHYGADDFGGTVMEENVHKATGWINQVGIEEMIDMIRQSGFKPVQRNSFYQLLKTYEN